MARRCPFRALTATLLDKLGLAYEFRHGKTHQCVRVEFPSGDRKLHFPRTASDHRAVKNHQAMLRRVCREEGFPNA